MVFGGLQKLSLVDYPNVVAAVVFTQGCLFRCPYCHNPELISSTNEAGVSTEEVLEYLRHKRVFLDGVCITGGEPTLHADLPDFMRTLKDLGFSVKLDTNGANPQMVQRVIDEGVVDYFAMDIKGTWERYSDFIHIKNEQLIKNCQQTMRIIQHSGIDHEFRTTVFPSQHQISDFYEIAGYLQKGEKYYIQNIEFKKNLDTRIDQTLTIDVTQLVSDLQERFPALTIGARQ